MQARPSRIVRTLGATVMPSDVNPLERQFHEAMLGIYEAAKHLSPPYHAPRFLRMVNEHGGKEAANRLLATGEPSEGFTQLFPRGKENLKLSVEYLVLTKPYRALFDDEQLAVARQRLHDYEFSPPSNDA
jgi:hypothetical protein